MNFFKLFMRPRRDVSRERLALTLDQLDKEQRIPEDPRVNTILADTLKELKELPRPHNKPDVVIELSFFAEILLLRARGKITDSIHSLYGYQVRTVPNDLMDGKQVRVVYTPPTARYDIILPMDGDA